MGKTSTTTLKVGDVVRHRRDVENGFNVLGLVIEVGHLKAKIMWASKKAQSLPSEYWWYKIQDLMLIS